MPRVLISYSHDSKEHAERVLQLSNQLREHGVDCLIDQYEPTPSEGWPLWMERQIERADFVLCLCSEEYARRFRLDGELDVGKGVAWEAMLIRNALYSTKSANNKFVVVQFDRLVTSFVPACLQSYTSFVITQFSLEASGYEKLYRRITHQPAVIKPIVGEAVKLLTKQNEPANEFLSGTDFLEFQKGSRLEAQIDQLELSADGAKVMQLCEIWTSRLRAFQFAEAEAIAGDSSGLKSIQKKISLAKQRVAEFCSNEKARRKDHWSWQAITSFVAFLLGVVALLIMIIFWNGSKPNGRLVEVPAKEVLDLLYNRNLEATSDSPSRPSKLEELKQQKSIYSRSVPFRLVGSVILESVQVDGQEFKVNLIPKDKSFFPDSRSNYSRGVFVVHLRMQELPEGMSVDSTKPVEAKYQSVEVTIDEITLIDFNGFTNDSLTIFANGSQLKILDRESIP